MGAFGSGSALWKVDVVLRRDGATEEHAESVVSHLAEAASTRPTAADEALFPDVRETSSFDLQPSGGSLGVSCWVRADTLGEAAQLGLDTVVAAALEVTGRVLPLWDLRVVPRSAIGSLEECNSGTL